MATGDEIKMLIEDFSADLALALLDPAEWGMWLVYLIEQLEKQAADLGQPVERFDLSLELLRQAAGERLQGHQ